MGNGRGRFHKDRRAMSPHKALLYFAVVPLLCTLMLALPLGYYTTTSMSGNKVAVPTCNIMLEPTEQGNWTLTVIQGQLNANKVTMLAMSDINGTKLFFSQLNGSSDNFTWNDNNRNGRLDGGDIILVNQTGVPAGSHVELFYDQHLFFYNALPSRGRR